MKLLIIFRGGIRKPRAARGKSVDSKNESNQLNLSLAAKNFMLTDSNSIKNVLIYASASNDSMKFKTQWVNNDLLNNKGKLSGYAAFEINMMILYIFI
jgi:hypothetical protein